MAAGTHVPEPLCLIENSPHTGLAVREEALQALAGIGQPVVVVAITGLYRTGKSYLMNRLAQQRTGFALGSSVRGCTKGVWMWCVPHPRRPGHTLVLLDTEGLGDVETGDSRNDVWIFVLAVLLSSTLIYNSRGTIDRQAMDSLHYVAKLAEHIEVRNTAEGGEEPLPSAGFAQFFPTFVWAVRDFTLQLEKDGRELSEDEYLEDALRLRAGSSPEAQRCNQLRECIRQFFPERRCFVFEQPVGRKELAHLEELPDDRLSPSFLQRLEEFCGYIWGQAPPKTTPGGHAVTGSMLGTLAKTYVEAIRRGDAPCLESAVLALTEIHNSAAARDAEALYRELMGQRAELPTETARELQELHARCEQEALQLFEERAFADDTQRFRAELLLGIEAAYAEICGRNERASRDKCVAALRELCRDLERRVSKRSYLAPGGYQQFQADQQALVEKYRELPGKGVKADAVLQEFLESKEPLARNILNADRALTEKDKQLKRQQAQREGEKREWEARNRRDAEKLQALRDQVRSFEEQVLRLRKKLQEKKTNQRAPGSEGSRDKGSWQYSKEQYFGGGFSGQHSWNAVHMGVLVVVMVSTVIARLVFRI